MSTAAMHYMTICILCILCILCIFCILMSKSPNVKISKRVLPQRVGPF